jgi:hypothetical protein
MKINITMNQDEQNAVCLRCTLPDCVGIEDRRCLIQVEQRERWRRDYERRKASGEIAARNARKVDRQAAV